MTQLNWSLGTFGGGLDKLVRDTFLDKNAQSGTAAPTLVQKEANVCCLKRTLDITVIQDNESTLSTKLEQDSLEVGLSGVLMNVVTDHHTRASA
jgi:hypothetical protein